MAKNKTTTTERKAPSAKQRANWARFAKMARARAVEKKKEMRAAAARSPSRARASTAAPQEKKRMTKKARNVTVPVAGLTNVTASVAMLNNPGAGASKPIDYLTKHKDPPGALKAVGRAAKNNWKGLAASNAAYTLGKRMFGRKSLKVPLLPIRLRW